MKTDPCWEGRGLTPWAGPERRAEAGSDEGTALRVWWPERRGRRHGGRGGRRAGWPWA